MGNKLLLSGIQVFLFASLLTSCDKDDTIIERLAIKLDKHSVSVVPAGAQETLQLTANADWEVKEVPEWILIDKMEGTKNDQLTIHVKENRARKGRSHTLTIFCGNTRDTMNISQQGLADLVLSPALPLFFLSDIEMSGDDSNQYTVTTKSMFVNPDIRSKIYLGNLISPKAQTATNMTEFTGYTFNPITISSPVIYSREIYPSRSEQEAYVQDILAANPKQVESFVSDNGTTEFYTYKQLHAIGNANLGIKLDELVKGFPYAKEEMTKNFGLIFSFKKLVFSVAMDYPIKLIKENLKTEDRDKGVAYVSTVSYGKVGLLIGESDIDSRDFKVAVNNYLSNRSLTQTEINILDNTDLCYVSFDNNGQPQKQSGSWQSVLTAYRNALTSDNSNIYPVQFGLADFDHHGISPISFSFSVTK